MERGSLRGKKRCRCMATEAADFDSTQSYKDPKEPVSCLTDSPRHFERQEALRRLGEEEMERGSLRGKKRVNATSAVSRNSCIRSGYRPELGSFRACVRSLTFPHNELRTSSLTPASISAPLRTSGGAAAARGGGNGTRLASRKEARERVSLVPRSAGAWRPRQPISTQPNRTKTPKSPSRA
jgi:hypothetical protein